MARYKDSDVISLLYSLDCSFDGEEVEVGQPWCTSEGHVFSIPHAVNGWFDAEVIDRILSDRWIPRPLGRPARYEDVE